MRQQQLLPVGGLGVALALVVSWDPLGWLASNEQSRREQKQRRPGSFAEEAP